MVRSSSLTAPPPLTGTWKGMPPMMQNPLMQTQQMVGMLRGALSWADFTRFSRCPT